MMTGTMTLDEFIIDQQLDFPHATGDLSSLLSSIQFAAQVVTRELNKAGLVDILGSSGSDNIQGEEQQKLDLFANDTFKSALEARHLVCGIASEEEDEAILFDHHKHQDAKYIVLMDPLDGSSNIDVNVSVGTIFSIYRRLSPTGTPATSADFLQKGREQVAAGYIIYGPSTMLVYTTGNGVHGFTYDPSLGTFCLSNKHMRTPEIGRIYSINEGHYCRFSTGIKKYIKYCQEENTEQNRPYTSRYIGSLVADFHRNLLKGGVYLYPSSITYPNGKLRLLYECNPMAFLIEQAGGSASDGRSPILDIEPNQLHQRVSFVAGSKLMVEKVELFITQYD